MKFNAYKFFFQTHLWTGLILGLLLTVISLSGCVLLFKSEIDRALWADCFYVKVPAGAQRLPLDELVARVRANFPGDKVVRLNLLGDPQMSVQILTNKRLNVFVDPYRGDVLGSRVKERTFIGQVEVLHRFFLLGPNVGRAIQGTCAAIFVYMILSGVYLWWPKSLKGLKQGLAVNWKLKGRAFNVSLHKVFGMYAALVLLVSASTGLVDTLNRAPRGFGVPSPALPPKPNLPAKSATKDPIEAMWRQTQQLVPNPQDTVINLAGESVWISAVGAGQTANARNELYFDPKTAELLQFRPFAANSLAGKLTYLALPVHTGLWGSGVWRAALLVGALTLTILVITGYWLYLKRTFGRRAGSGAAVVRVASPGAISDQQPTSLPHP